MITILLGNRPGGRDMASQEKKCVAQDVTLTEEKSPDASTRVGTLIVGIIYLQLIQNRYMFRSFTVLQCSHQHCVQPVASDVEVVGYL